MKIIDEVISKVDVKLMDMFDQTIEAHTNAIEALVQSDNKKAVKCIEQDQEINQLEEEIIYDCMIVIAKHQPVAKDLRKVISTIRIANDLERVADYAKTISKTAIVNSNETFLTDMFLKNSLKMSNIIVEMLKEEKKAILSNDADLAHNIITNEVSLSKYMSETFESNPFSSIKKENVESYMSLMGVLRTLERSRGHIANISESVIFTSTGRFVEL